MPKQKRRPELSRPGLKQQTPHEQRITKAEAERLRARWEYLFHPDRNRWVLTRPAVASTSCTT